MEDDKQLLMDDSKGRRQLLLMQNSNGKSIALR